MRKNRRLTKTGFISIENGTGDLKLFLNRGILRIENLVDNSYWYMRM